MPASADLSIAKTGTANPAPGRRQLHADRSNDGPDTAQRRGVNDSLPSQFTATGASGGGFNVHAYRAGRAGRSSARARARPDRGAPAADHDHRHGCHRHGRRVPADVATVSSNTDDPDLTNNTATFIQVIGPVADLTITKLALVSAGGPAVTNRSRWAIPSPTR